MRQNNGMDFSEALKYLKNGYEIRRKAWNRKDCRIKIKKMSWGEDLIVYSYEPEFSYYESFDDDEI